MWVRMHHVLSLSSIDMVGNLEDLIIKKKTSNPASYFEKLLMKITYK